MRTTGASEKSRITLLLLGSSSLCESDRTPGGSPIEKIYKSYGKAGNVTAGFRFRRGARPLVLLHRASRLILPEIMTCHLVSFLAITILLSLFSVWRERESLVGWTPVTKVATVAYPSSPFLSAR